MSFAKFLLMLERQALWFSRLNALEDPFEGAYSEPTIASHKIGPRAAKDLLSHVSSHAKQIVAVNCWHMSEYESNVLWTHYCGSTEGIAIMSSCLALERCFQATSTSVYVGCVKYIDYDTETIQTDNVFYACTHKRKLYELEHELWAVPMISGAEVESAGVYVSVALPQLIGNVYIHPKAPVWFTDLVQAKLQEHRLPILAVQSRLADEADV